jgi:protein subunit release factor B
LFRLARDDTRKDSDDLDLLSEFVALLPDEGLRRLALLEISLHLTRATGDELVLPSIYQLPELKEEDITETFIRGSGPGGQKINKTSNRVLLIHKPTNLRVECQDTRSLQQNRKLARKRLRLKLDEHLNGSQSLESTNATKASTKKAKAKARSRKRQRQRQEANESDSSDDPLDQTEHHA